MRDPPSPILTRLFAALASNRMPPLARYGPLTLSFARSLVVNFSLFRHALSRAGVTPDATVEALPSAESREYEAHLEEEWGARAVAALGEPLPSSQDLNKGLAVPSSGDDKGSVEDDGEGEEGDGGRDGVGGGAAGGSTEGEVVLLLACLCRGLGTNFVVCVPEILGRSVRMSVRMTMGGFVTTS